MFGGLYGNFNMNNACCGGKHESYEKGLSEEINSKDIIKFSYTGTDYGVTAEKIDNKVKIHAIGGGKYNKRDGSYFIVRYETEDTNIFQLLQEAIDKYNVKRDNGHCVHVDGLPGGIGDTISVTYLSGERIYKTSNQSVTISYDAIKEFYEIFHEEVKKKGYDFTTAGSNVKLFDDADEEYLQGTWKGKHFGNEIEVTFKNKTVTIKVDNQITDENIEYIIKDGFIKKNKLSEGKTGEKYSDYEDFTGVSSFAKKNYFTMTAYFYTPSYSTCDLMNFDKEKPKED